jgi:hypothetical protein
VDFYRADNHLTIEGDLQGMPCQLRDNASPMTWNLLVALN